MSKKTIALVEVLRSHYPFPDNAFIEEFRGGTGFDRESRADAIAMHLWPSKGLELIGFELKTSRADWLKEMKSPGKADPIKQFCSRWYLVVDDRQIIKTYNSELPDDWGLMYVGGNNKIITEKEAPQLKPKPIDSLFLASLMRRASKPLDEVFINGRKYTAINP